jgi:hypothetical protein
MMAWRIAGGIVRVACEVATGVSRSIDTTDTVPVHTICSNASGPTRGPPTISAPICRLIQSADTGAEAVPALGSGPHHRRSGMRHPV